MNKIMFWVGMAIVAITVILLVVVEYNWVPIGIIGIGLIATSGYKPLKQKKK